MHLASLVDMIESAFADRVLLGGERRLTGADIGQLARAGSASLGGRTAVVYAGENHPFLPVPLLSAACAGVPYIPLNYRLTDEQLNALVSRQSGALVLADKSTASRITSVGATNVDDWLAGLTGARAEMSLADDFDDGDVAVVLYTSGTTSEPKAALLRHRHLMAYLIGAVEFAGADPAEAVLVSVPPYHIAGVANTLSNLYAGRRLIYLNTFSAATWLDTVRREAATNAMVVPTMLTRIVEELAGSMADVPTLRSLSYGGARLSERVLRDAIKAFPNTGFVNAYGLTETASTIAVLGPEDHLAALESDDQAVQRRLQSAGKVLPTIDVEIRDEDGTVLPEEAVGMIYLRGPQIAGEYAGAATLLDTGGWFCTRDRGWMDADGYLYIEGRADDTIIRGGENIAPAEIEEVLLAHPHVQAACAVGLPDDEWGNRIAVAVVAREGSAVAESELQEWVRARLRGSKTPDHVAFCEELPYTETGKMLRRVVLADFLDGRLSARAMDSSNN
ncbi:class I adenylate-forming enzyme family protein [Mycobacterium sp. E1747]|uniref:class I adenylate-forming enzyme family protein n=1 Tax=Mycobacterium sp. E1747 TaxID=1834128 RepID=UPI0007FD9F2B|nr:fatty acid--CoA ligase family protein [Mycobacterium sp. E1747]OBH08872.1 hypothetical protein A5695_25580 [Mycobacterium sp. E1747]